MWQVRFHGRGGQGVVTAAELLSAAAFRQGLHAQAFPMFGSERMGAPVVSFVRAARRPIRAHDPVTQPDAVVVQDVTLIGAVDILAGLGAQGFVVVNTARPRQVLDALSIDGHVDLDHVVCVPATDLALAHLGRPVPNAPLLGALAARTGWISLASLADALHDRFPDAVADANLAAAHAAFLMATQEVDGARAG